MPSPTDRRQEILEYATELLRSRGFNAFSHRDLAERTGIKSSSIHYHFPTKQCLGMALIQQYKQEQSKLLDALRDLPANQRLNGFAAPFLEATNRQHWCLAGMLASDYASLDEPLRGELRQFFHDTEKWLAEQIQEIDPALAADQALVRARAAMALLEGALLLARAQQDPQRMHDAVELFHVLMGMAMPAKT